MDEPDVGAPAAADAPETMAPGAAEDEPAPAALVMVEADGADACAVDGTCW